MKIIDFFRDYFGSNSTYMTVFEAKSTKLALENFAVDMAVNLIAGAIAKCEFKTFIDGEEIKKDEHYIWNVEPNRNQNSSEFIQEIICKLIKNNQALVVEINGQLIISDNNFQIQKFALGEYIFSNVSRDGLTFNRTFKQSVVLYYKLHNDDIKSTLSNLTSGYANLLEMATGKYKRSGGRKGTAKINRTNKNDKEEEDRINNFFTKKMKAYFENENAVITLPNGIEYTELTGDGSKKSTSEVTDIINITKEVITRTAQALNIPPSLLLGEIADVEKVTNNFISFAIAPIVDIIATENNRKRYGKSEYIKGTYMKIDTSKIRYRDLFDIATSADKLISSGLTNIDELRERTDLQKKNKPFSTKHYITKNYQDIEDLKGGEILE